MSERDELLITAMAAFAPWCRFRVSLNAPEPISAAEKAAQCTYKGVALGDFSDDGLRALIASLSDPGDKDANAS